MSHDRFGAVQGAREVAADLQHVLADRLAEEARVDAELSTAQSQAAKNQAVNAEMIKSTQPLSDEMQRNSGAK